MDTSPGGLDWDEEPLFADDINSDDEDPPPLPPPMPPLSQLSQAPNRTHPAADGEGGEMADWDTSRRRTSTDGDQRGTDQDAPQKKRAPILTLTIDRVFSEKGLPYLEKEFPKLKFKGKGHEAADLRHLMKHYEHWANSLYPKLTFKDVTDRIEKLATKKEFKTKLVQMRHRWAQQSTPPRPLRDNEAHDITEHHNGDVSSDSHHHSNSPTHQQNEVNSTPESPPNSSQTRQETTTEIPATSTKVRVPEAVEDELDGLLAEEEQLMMEESDTHIPSGFDL